MLRKYIDEVFKKIISQNQLNSVDSIPHSDTLFKFVESNIGLDFNLFNQVINILKESHKILIMQVSKEDVDQDIKSVDGYIDADITTVKKLKGHFNRVLADLYEEEYHKRVAPYQIVRELFPIMNRLHRTPIGSIANKAIMLDEFEKLLQKEFNSYTEDRKAKLLDELLEKHEKNFSGSIKARVDTDKEIAKNQKIENNKRAVDSKPTDDFSKASLNKVLQIYGVEFFFRINLRKYNFNFIGELIEKRQIKKRQDLKLLKKMLQRVKDNTDNDSKLLDYKDQIYKLDRIISSYINIS